MDETARRRKIQTAYNKEHHITPKTIKKDIRDLISVTKPDKNAGKKDDFVETDFESMTLEQQKDMIKRLEDEMRSAAKKLDFEHAATLRDTVLELKAELDN